MRTATIRLVFTAFFVALGCILPPLFHMIGAGTVFLPMHIPVLLCGFVCGAPYGAACGVIVPLLSSLFTGMPPVFPTALAMALELCCYGAITGLMFIKFNWNLYASLIAAMLCGRIISGLANMALLGLAGQEYSLKMFLTASFITSMPGIIIQIIVVPAIIAILVKTQVITRTKDPKSPVVSGG